MQWLVLASCYYHTYVYSNGIHCVLGSAVYLRHQNQKPTDLVFKNIADLSCRVWFWAILLLQKGKCVGRCSSLSRLTCGRDWQFAALNHYLLLWSFSYKFLSHQTQINNLNYNFVLKSSEDNFIFLIIGARNIGWSRTGRLYSFFDIWTMHTRWQSLFTVARLLCFLHDSLSGNTLWESADNCLTYLSCFFYSMHF